MLKKLAFLVCATMIIASSSWGATHDRAVNAVFCGKIGTSFLTCHISYGDEDQHHTTCVTTGSCDGDDKCVPNSPEPPEQNTFPSSDWDRKYYGVEDGNDQLKSTTHMCYETMGCKPDCKLVNGRMECQMASTLADVIKPIGPMTFIEKIGDCNPNPNPPADPNGGGEPVPVEVP